MKFICDDNLGRLARWLRTLGYDTLFERDYTDERIMTLALSESRTIITRDHALAEKVLAREAVLLTTTDPLLQLKEVLSARGLRPSADLLFSRCADCNTEVLEVRKEEIATLVPPYVFRTQDRFHRCPSCRRIFWAGTHVQRMREKLAGQGIIGQE